MAKASHDPESDLMSNGQGNMGLPNTKSPKCAGNKHNGPVFCPDCQSDCQTARPYPSIPRLQ